MSSSSSLVCGGNQLLSSLKRISIEKRRSLRSTLCECFSHLILVLILIAGYNYSKVIIHDNRIYSNIKLAIPPVYTDPVTGSTVVGLQALPLQVKNLVDGPLIIPTFDQYYLIGRLVRSLFGNNPSASLAFTANSFGRSFSNLLNPGSLHFAPNNELTQSLIQYINTTYTSLHQTKVYIHNSEQDGVDYILSHLDEPAWALINLKEATLTKVSKIINLIRTNNFDYHVFLIKYRLIISSVRTIQQSQTPKM